MLDLLIKFLQYIISQINDVGMTLEADSMVLLKILVVEDSSRTYILQVLLYII